MLTKEIVYRKQKNIYKKTSFDIIYYKDLSIHQKINLRYFYLKSKSYIFFYNRKNMELCSYVLRKSSTIFNKDLSIFE